MNGLLKGCKHQTSRPHLEFDDVDVSHQVPPWLAFFVVSVETQSAHVVHQIAENPGEVILDTVSWDGHVKVEHSVPQWLVDDFCLRGKL